MTRYEEQLGSIRTSAAFFEAIDPSDHALAVPTCPGWTVGDVIRHVAWQGPPAWVAIMSGRDPQPELAAAVAERRPIGASLAALVDHLEAHDASEACPTYVGEVDFGWWGVHGSVEIALHRCDVAAALGRPADLSGSEARDGLTWSRALLGPMSTFTSLGEPAPLALAAEEFEPLQLGTGEPAATVSGAAADLVLWLWGRGRGGVTVTGDATVADAWSSISGQSFQHEAFE